jgi:hypothetical protein
LAKALFEQRRAFDTAATNFPACRPVLAQLRAVSEIGGGEIESRLRELQAQADGYPERARHITAVRFYLQEILEFCSTQWLQRTAGITNYVLLIDLLALWRHAHASKVLIVTFNYDTLIEGALEDVLNIRFDHIGNYVARDDFTLLKPHGSVNWGREAEWPFDELTYGLQARQTICNHAEELEISEDFSVLVSIDSVFERRDGRPPIVQYPAIAIPVDRKSRFECPAEHLRILADLLPAVDQILIVGWRATEEHFLHILRDQLGEKPREILVVSESEESAKATSSNLHRAKINVVESGAFHVPIESGIGMSGLVREGDENVLRRFLH